MTGNGCQANPQTPDSSTVPSPSPPPTKDHNEVKQLVLPWRLPQAPPYTINKCPLQRVKAALPIHRNKHREAAKLRRQRNIKEQNKTLEKELDKMEIANLSDAESKTLVIRMLKELTEYGNNIKEEMKITLSEILKKTIGNQQ